MNTSMIKKESMNPNIYEIWTQDLAKYYARGEKQVKAVDGIDIHMEPGIHGFLGPNGAGKTSTINMVIGAISITKGEAKIRGIKAGTVKSRKKVGFLPQDPGYCSKMTGREYINFIAQMSGINKRKAEIKTNELIKKFDLNEAEDRKIETYSGGMKQKVGIISALVGDPKIMILDEPTSDLDPIMRNNIIKEIKILSKEMSIFVSSHVLSEVEQMCNKVTIINKGKILVTDTIKNIKNMHSSANIIFILDTNSNNKIIQELNGKDFIEKIWIDEIDDHLNIIPKNVEELQRSLPEILIKNNLLLKKFYQQESSLQDVFLDMMNNDGEEINVN